MEQHPNPQPPTEPRPSPDRMAELKAAYKDGTIDTSHQAASAGEGIKAVEDRAWINAEQRHQNEVAGAHGDATVENRQRNIDARVDEVRELNDMAELDVYGSRHNTYTKTYTKRDTGEKYQRVIASPKKPKTGKLDEIRTNPRYGTKKADREAAAEEYENELLSLVDDGLELSQAKLVMDLREKAQDDIEAQATEVSRLKHKLIEQGHDPSDAEARASIHFAKKYEGTEGAISDDRRLEIIKDFGEKGVFTKKEYEKAKKEFIASGGDVTLPDPEPEPIDPNDPPTPPERLPLDQHFAIPNGTQGSGGNVLAVRGGSALARNIMSDPEGQNMLHDLGNALNRYTSLQPKLDRTILMRGKTKNEIEEARQEYEQARMAVNERIARALEDQGYNAEEISAELMAQDVGVYAPSNDPANPGVREISGGESGLVRDLTRQEAERIAKESRFVGWWGRQSGKMGFLKKAGVMLPVGIAAGAALGPVLGAGVGAAAGGLVAKRVATNLMRNRVSNSADAATHAQAHTGQRHTQQVNRRVQDTREFYAGGGSGIAFGAEVTSAHIEGARDVHGSNQRRAVTSMGVGLAAGAVAGEVADSLLSHDTPVDIHGHHGGNHNHQPDSHPHHSNVNHHNGAPGTENVQYGDLQVAPGSGFEDSLQNQYGLSDAQAHQAYEAMQAHLQGAPGTYDISPGNIGVSSPGDFHVPPAAQQDLHNYLESINKAE